MLIRRIRRFLGQSNPPVVSVLRLSGVIAASGGFRPGLSMQTMAEPIERAFQPDDLAAVALVINSPGGSPAQSSLIGSRIRAFAEEKKVPVIAFVEDVAASGGYWIACAADEIVADPSSIVGSIGVISQSFGFQDLIARWGVERRLYTAGERKSLLDPFQPERAEDVERLKSLQAELHETFKAWVRTRRAGRLKAAEGDLFNGEFWTAAKGLELGLVDALGDVRSVLRARFGDKVVLRGVTERKSWVARRFGLTGGGGALPDLDLSGLPGAAIRALEDRAIWGRFGL